jgi:hypothetical protein
MRERRCVRARAGYGNFELIWLASGTVRPRARRLRTIVAKTNSVGVADGTTMATIITTHIAKTGNRSVVAQGPLLGMTIETRSICSHSPVLVKQIGPAKQGDRCGTQDDYRAVPRQQLGRYACMHSKSRLAVAKEQKNPFFPTVPL